MCLLPSPFFFFFDDSLDFLSLLRESRYLLALLLSSLFASLSGDMLAPSSANMTFTPEVSFFLCLIGPA